MDKKKPYSRPKLIILTKEEYENKIREHNEKKTTKKTESEKKD